MKPLDGALWLAGRRDDEGDHEREAPEARDASDEAGDGDDPPTLLPARLPDLPNALEREEYCRDRAEPEQPDDAQHQRCDCELVGVRGLFAFVTRRVHHDSLTDLVPLLLQSVGSHRADPQHALNISTGVSMSGMPDDACDLLCLDLDKAEALRRQRLPAELARAAAGEFKALADPTRLGLALALRDGGELCVCDLAWVSERAENLVSHHMRLLRSQGLVESRRDGKMVLYSLTERGRALLDLVSIATAPA